MLFYVLQVYPDKNDVKNHISQILKNISKSSAVILRRKNNISIFQDYFIKTTTQISIFVNVSDVAGVSSPQIFSIKLPSRTPAFSFFSLLQGEGEISGGAAGQLTLPAQVNFYDF